MKRTKLALFLTVAALLLSSVCVVGASAASVYTAKYTDASPVIDGTIDAAWDAAEWTSLTKVAGADTNAVPMFKLLNDDNYVYFLGVAAADGYDAGNNDGFILGFCGANGCTEHDGVKGSKACSTHKELRLFTAGGKWQGFDSAAWATGNVSDILGNYAVNVTGVTIGEETYYVYEASLLKTSVPNMTATMGLEVAYADMDSTTTTWVNEELYYWTMNAATTVGDLTRLTYTEGYAEVTLEASSSGSNVPTAPYTTITPVNDGAVDAIWATANWNVLQICKGPESAFRPKFKMLHDDENVYILAVAAAEGYTDSNGGVEGFYISFSNGTPCGATCDTMVVSNKTVCKNHKQIRFFVNGSSYQTYGGSKTSDGWIGSPESYIAGYSVAAATVEGNDSYVYEITIKKSALEGGIGAAPAFEFVYVNGSATKNWNTDNAYSWAQAADYAEVPGSGQNSGIYSNTAGFATVVLEPLRDDVDINEFNFPDEVFRTYLADNFDDGDGILSIEERSLVAMIDLTDSGLTTLQGIHYFPELLYLYCDGNALTTLDLNANTKLVGVYADANVLTSVNVGNCTELTVLSVGDNLLTSLDVSKNTELLALYCNANPLTTLDIRANTALECLSIAYTDIAELDVSAHAALRELYCYETLLTKLDISANTELEYLDIENCAIPTLDISNNLKLVYLWCSGNGLTTLDVTNHLDLVYLYCHGNALTKLDLKNNAELIELSCSDNLLTELDLSANTKLDTLWCSNNKLSSLDLSANTALVAVDCTGNVYETTAAGGVVNASMLPGNFNAGKASNWKGCMSGGSMIIITGLDATVTYDYDLGNGFSETFTLKVTNAPKAPTTGTQTPSTGTQDSTTTPTEPWVNPYSDVADDHPNIDAIEYVTQKGIFQGTDANNPTFSEDMVLTRAQFVTILGRLAEVDVTEYTAKVFSDVDPKKASDAWFAPYVAWASENGIVYGYTDGTFGPQDEITVEQAVAILARFARYQEKYNVSVKTLDAYADADDVSSWALADMQWAVEQGLYTGEEGNLQPKALTDRLLTAILVYLYDITL